MNSDFLSVGKSIDYLVSLKKDYKEDPFYNYYLKDNKITRFSDHVII